jgi:glycogen(starch) synthase
LPPSIWPAHPPRNCSKNGGLAGKTVIGFIGSFYAYEGLDLLLDALPAIIQKTPDIRVLLVGGGPQEANLRQQADKLGLKDHVIFTGRVPHSEVNRYYDLINVLAYPRHPMRLTELVTPLKPLEAMAQGQLFVASDVGGHKELVEHNKTGILFKAGDRQAWRKPSSNYSTIARTGQHSRPTDGNLLKMYATGETALPTTESPIRAW